MDVADHKNSSLRHQLNQIWKEFQENNDTQETDDNSIQNREKLEVNYVLISRNPQSILSLDPEQLSSMLNVTPEQVHSLRQRISNTILASKSTNSTQFHFAADSSLFNLCQKRRENENTSRRITTGSNALDNLISSTSSSMSSRKRSRRQEENVNQQGNIERESGIAFGKIVQFSGPSSSGKTQLALSLAVNTITLSTRSPWVYYICSGGGNVCQPLSRRIRQIIAMLKQQGKIDDREVILDSIYFDHVDNGHDLLARLKSLEHELMKDNDNEDLLLVIDSMSGCFGNFVYSDGDGGVGSAIFSECKLLLRRISHVGDVNSSKQVAVLITNGMVSSSDAPTGRKPALGELLRISDVHFELQPWKDMNVVSENTNGHKSIEKVVVRGIKAIKLDENNKSEGQDEIKFGIGVQGIMDI